MKFKSIMCLSLVALLLFFNVVLAVSSSESNFIYVGYKNMTENGLLWDGDYDYDLVITDWELDVDEVGEIIRVYFETSVTNSKKLDSIVPVKTFETEKQYVKVGEDFVLSGTNTVISTIKADTYSKVNETKSGSVEIYKNNLPAEIHFGEESSVVNVESSNLWRLDNGLIRYDIRNVTDEDFWYYWNTTSNSWSRSIDFDITLQNATAKFNNYLFQSVMESVTLVVNTTERKTYNVSVKSTVTDGLTGHYLVSVVANIPIVFMEIYNGLDNINLLALKERLAYNTSGVYIPAVNTTADSHSSTQTFLNSLVTKNYVATWNDISAYVLCYDNKTYSANTTFRVGSASGYGENGLGGSATNLNDGDKLTFGISGFTFDGTENDDEATDTDKEWGYNGVIDSVPNCLDYNNTATCTLWDYSFSVPVSEWLCSAYGRNINGFDISLSDDLITSSDTSITAVQDTTYLTPDGNDFGITYDYLDGFYENTTSHNVTVADVPAGNGTVRLAILNANSTSSYNFLFNISNSISINSTNNIFQTHNWTKYTTYDFVDDGVKFNITNTTLTQNVTTLNVGLTNVSLTSVIPTTECPTTATSGVFESCYYDYYIDHYRGVQITVPSINGTGTSGYINASLMGMAGGIEINSTIVGNTTALTDYNVYITNGTKTDTKTSQNNNVTINANDWLDGDELNITVYKADYENVTFTNQAIYFNNVTILEADVYPNSYFYAINSENSTIINSFTLNANNGTTSTNQSTSTGELNWTMRTFPQGDVNLTFYATHYITGTNSTTVNDSSDAKNITEALDPVRIFLNAFDENTEAEIEYFNITLINSTSSTTYSNITEFNALYTNDSIERGSIDVEVIDTAGTYGKRKLYETFSSTQNLNMTMYLVTTTDGQSISFNIIDQTEDNVVDAIVTAFRTISGTVSVMDEETTDSTGSAQLFLDYDNEYTIMVCKSGTCVNNTFSDFTDDQKQIKLQLANYTLYNSTIWAGVTWSLSPENQILDIGNQTINVSCYNSHMDFSYWGLWINASDGTNLYNQNSTTSDGGNITGYANMTAYANVTAYFFFKKASMDSAEFVSRFYRIDEWDLENSTLQQALQYLDEVINTDDETGFRDLIILIITGYLGSAIAGVLGISVALAITIIAMSILVIMKWLNFITWFVMILGVGLFYLMRERY